jgi:hypothetical protein
LFGSLSIHSLGSKQIFKNYLSNNLPVPTHSHHVFRVVSVSCRELSPCPPFNAHGNEIQSERRNVHFSHLTFAIADKYLVWNTSLLNIIFLKKEERKPQMNL